MAGRVMDKKHFDEQFSAISSTASIGKTGSSSRWPTIGKLIVDQIILPIMTVTVAENPPMVRRQGSGVDAETLDLRRSDAEILGARIEALAESDRIDGTGDLRKWRHSEVRLKD